MTSSSSTFTLATTGDDLRVQVAITPGEVTLTVQTGDNDPVVVPVDVGNRRTVQQLGYAVIEASDFTHHRQPAEHRPPAEFLERFPAKLAR